MRLLTLTLPRDQQFFPPGPQFPPSMDDLPRILEQWILYSTLTSSGTEWKSD